MEIGQKFNQVVRMIKLCCLGIVLCACGQNSSIQETDKEEQISEQIMPAGNSERALDSCLDKTTTREKVNHGEDSELAEWKQAYLDYLDNFAGADSFVYSLIYVDDDEIPELVIDSGFGNEGIIVDGGCQALLTFHDHGLDVWKPIHSRFTYIERANLICNVWSSREDASFNLDNVYTIENGKWVYVGGGYWEWRTRGFAFMKHDVCEYYWDENGVDIQVGKEEYNKRLNAIYPEGEAKYPQDYCGLDEICSMIRIEDEALAGDCY